MNESATPAQAPAMAPGTGRALWRLLHAYANGYPATATAADMANARRFLGQFAVAVEEAAPPGMCRCAAGWRELVLQVPPRLQGREAFCRWAQVVHDLVNVKLGKRRWLSVRADAALMEQPNSKED